jgi:hypothetical protein
MLRAPSAELAKKLGFASQLRIGKTRIKEDDIVYTTEKDNLDQESADQLIEFDKKLKEGRGADGDFDASP